MQWKDYESAAAEDCLALAQEVETMTNEVIDQIADTLDVYSSCHCDKVNSYRFIVKEICGSSDSVVQALVLFESEWNEIQCLVALIPNDSIIFYV